MHDAAPVCGFDAERDLARDGSYLFKRELRVTVKMFAKVYAIDEFHDDVGSAFGQQAVIVCIRDVRMIESGGGACFTAETL